MEGLRRPPPGDVEITGENSLSDARTDSEINSSPPTPLAGPPLFGSNDLEGFTFQYEEDIAPERVHQVVQMEKWTSAKGHCDVTGAVATDAESIGTSRGAVRSGNGSPKGEHKGKGSRRLHSRNRDFRYAGCKSAGKGSKGKRTIFTPGGARRNG